MLICVVLYYKYIEKAMIIVITFTKYKVPYSLPLNSKSGLSIYYYFDNNQIHLIVLIIHKYLNYLHKKNNNYFIIVLKTVFLLLNILDKYMHIILH